MRIELQELQETDTEGLMLKEYPEDYKEINKVFHH